MEWSDGTRHALGLEPTPELYIAHLVQCFRAVKRVLRDDGTLWCNIGDSQAANRGYQVKDSKWTDVGNEAGMTVPTGLKPKDCIGIPWMLAFALRADGWYWRDTIVWAKGASFCAGWSGSVMPESVRDRPTKAWETVLLFSKSRKYAYDWFGAREAGKVWTGAAGSFARDSKEADVPGQARRQHRADRPDGYSGNGTRNWRNVWAIPTRGTKFSHYAAYPIDLPAKCITAGTLPMVCGECGCPWERVVRKGEPDTAHRAACGADASGGYSGKSRPGAQEARAQNPSETKARILAGMRKDEVAGWRTTCGHPCRKPGRAVVLDPFGGTGTTAQAAEMLGRDSILIDLGSEYCDMAKERMATPWKTSPGGRKKESKLKPLF